MNVLVVGATGALRPAAQSLAAAGETVFGLARQVDLSGVVPIEVDYTDLPALDAALGELTCDTGVFYCPNAPEPAVLRLEAAVTGRVVRVLTSSYAAPPFEFTDLPCPPPVRVVLGWVAGERRWHTPAEISAAALAALTNGQHVQLGEIRPWDDRPV